MKLVYCLGVWLLVACTKFNGPVVGDADGYEGGDAVEASLNASRESITRGLAQVQAATDPEYLCEHKHCDDKSSKACQLLQNLTELQKQFCRDFFDKHGSAIAAIAPPSSQVKFKITGKPILIKSGDADREVDAATPAGPTGDVIFSGPRSAQLSASELLSLVFHELGHKIEIAAGRSIKDDEPIGPFVSGRHFLDTVGAALSAYVDSHRAPVVYEGVVPLFRLYHRPKNYHFFTTSEVERANQIQAGLEDESNGNLFYVYKFAQYAMVPVFRLHSSEMGRHAYTTSPDERAMLERLSYRFEKVECYVIGRRMPGYPEIYRLNNVDTAASLFTVNAATRDTIATTFPTVWKIDKSLGFGAPAAP